MPYVRTTHDCRITLDPLNKSDTLRNSASDYCTWQTSTAGYQATKQRWNASKSSHGNSVNADRSQYDTASWMMVIGRENCLDVLRRGVKPLRERCALSRSHFRSSILSGSFRSLACDVCEIRITQQQSNCLRDITNCTGQLVRSWSALLNASTTLMSAEECVSEAAREQA